MLYPMQEENLIAYLEDLSDHDEVESITLGKECDEYDIYIAEMISGRTYYIIYDQQPLAVFVQSQICQNEDDAMEVYQAYQD